MIKKVICSVNRGEVEESQHEINCVVINQNHKIIFQSGNTDKQYCLRSTLKPFQAAASLERETDQKHKLTTKEIAITCASHHGEPDHIKTVKSILRKTNLKESDLECGFHFPPNKENKTNLYSKKVSQSNIYNNCSGKHSGLLAFIKNLNLHTKGYINHGHPIHAHINNYIENLAGTKPKQYAIDGCSLPTPYFTLFTLAKMYIQLITAKPKTALAKVYAAMTEFPTMVSGTKGFDTHFMKTFNGQALSKGGAEGMQALAIKTNNDEHIALALKVTDGSHRGNYISCVKILQHLNIIDDKKANIILAFVKKDQYNLNKLKVGELVCNILD
jgi:L-asparaginase II